MKASNPVSPNKTSKIECITFSALTVTPRLVWNYHLIWSENPCFEIAGNNISLFILILLTVSARFKIYTSVKNFDVEVLL